MLWKCSFFSAGSVLGGSAETDPRKTSAILPRLSCAEPRGKRSRGFLCFITSDSECNLVPSRTFKVLPTSRLKRDNVFVFLSTVSKHRSSLALVSEILFDPRFCLKHWSSLALVSEILFDPWLCLSGERCRYERSHARGEGLPTEDDVPDFGEVAARGPDRGAVWLDEQSILYHKLDSS